MFTGLIREIANIKSFNNQLLSVEAIHRPKLGDSIAVNGACLTVVEIFTNGFNVELSHETMQKIALENLKNRVHIEPAMKMGDRFEGHIVQGHIDCLGKIEKIEKKNLAWDFYISMPKDFFKFAIPKGSVAIDGISLTINDIQSQKQTFRLTIIPHTLQNTLLSQYEMGQRVNIETDMFARYVYNIFKKDDSLQWEDVDKIMALY